jgi:2-polyprenyl-3-methyl-5-hydroxy-6-metoxy-1,4-benzoquinol methylase
MEQHHTREPQYEEYFTTRERYGVTRLGIKSNQIWHEDPRHLFFIMGRYKFVAKMLSGLGRVLEIGCGDAFFSRIVQQEVDHLTVLDFDPLFIQDIQDRQHPCWPVECVLHDMLDGPVQGPFDGIYAIDVIEHIAPADERRFLQNIVDSLTPQGVVLLGTPSLESQVYASARSVAGHVNCKSGSDWKKLLGDYFYNVFAFSMNDEVVHTGFFPMAHYLLTLCCNRK